MGISYGTDTLLICGYICYKSWIKIDLHGNVDLLENRSSLMVCILFMFSHGAFLALVQSLCVLEESLYHVNHYIMQFLMLFCL